MGGWGVEIKYIRTNLKIRASVYQKGLLVAPSGGDVEADGSPPLWKIIDG